MVAGDADGGVEVRSAGYDNPPSVAGQREAACEGVKGQRDQKKRRDKTGPQSAHANLREANWLGQDTESI
jgi:hypothetical protein